MSSHLRHCPKHKKPLPCSHCALTVKCIACDRQTPNLRTKLCVNVDCIEAREQRKKLAVKGMDEKEKTSVPNSSDLREPKLEIETSVGFVQTTVEETSKSQAAIRAAAWRAKQADLRDREAARKRLERSKQRDERIRREWSEQWSAEEAKAEESLRRAAAISEARYENGLRSGSSLHHGTDGRPLTLSDHKTTISLGGSSDAVAQISDRKRIEEMLGGRRVTPSGHSGNEEKDTPERDSDFAPSKKAFLIPDFIRKQIGGRVVRFYNLPEPYETYIERCLADNGIPKPTAWDKESAIVCGICNEKLADRYDFDKAYDHFANNHRKVLVEFIRGFEPKMFRPQRKKCQENHEGLAVRFRNLPGFSQKFYCGKCGKLLFKPQKLEKPRSDAALIEAKPETEHVN